METRLSVSIDKKLLELAVKALNAKSRAEAIRIALEEAVRLRRLKAVQSHAGKIDLHGNFEEIEQLRGQE